jgi:hypothetical protein
MVRIVTEGKPELSQNSDRDPLTEQEAAEVIANINSRRHFAGTGPRLRAWERALPLVVTPKDVKVAWERIRLARNGVNLGADPELLELRVADFKLKLEAWLNA